MQFKISKKSPSLLLAQFTKFCIVGVFGTAFNYSIFFILYHFLSVYYLLASTTGFISAIFLAFFLNKRFTFQITSTNKIRKMIIKYFLVNIYSTIIGLICLTFFVESLYTNTYLANLFVIGITTILNFTGSKLFAFKINEKAF